MATKPFMDISVVTSCHNYGRYLGDWAHSLVALQTWPRVVALVDNGSTDATWVEMQNVKRELERAGLPDVRIKRIPYTDFGSARNAAVDLGGDTEWVMHMDADDMFMPHCLDDVAKLAHKADVVPLGYERCGDLKAGPRNRTRVYSSTRGKQTLRSTAPASGVSPFRRSLWEASPYRTDMIGGWDTALWIGFAHMEARFVAARRPCFLYRQHADSVFNTRRLDRRTSKIVGAKLGNLRRQRSGVSILVPRRSDGGGPRDKAWDWLRNRYAVMYPDWEVVEGDHQKDGPWRKGAAIRSAYEASRGNTLIIADADCVLERQALLDAVRLVEEDEAPWVIPHTLVKRLDRPATEVVLREAQGKVDPPFEGSFIRSPYEGFPGGGFIIIDASKWAGAGGMPLAFAGWGAEDEATAEILATLVGPAVRLEYDLWHLWHPNARRGGQTHQRQNRYLLQVIRMAAGDADEMMALLERLEAGVPMDRLFAFGPNAAAVRMVAIMDFKRGREVIKKGDTFMATEEEAKRHESRPRKIAMRAAGAPAALFSPRDRTLEIRAEQHLRNLAARGAGELDGIPTQQEA